MKDKDSAKFWMGCVILFTFALVVIAILVGGYEIITAVIDTKNTDLISTVSGLIGAVLGYVAANAQQVVGYYFGSSSGSEKKTEAMANAIHDLKS